MQQVISLLTLTILWGNHVGSSKSRVPIAPNHKAHSIQHVLHGVLDLHLRLITSLRIRYDAIDIVDRAIEMDQHYFQLSTHDISSRILIGMLAKKREWPVSE